MSTCCIILIFVTVLIVTIILDYIMLKIKNTIDSNYSSIKRIILNVPIALYNALSIAGIIQFSIWVFEQYAK